MSYCTSGMRCQENLSIEGLKVNRLKRLRSARLHGDWSKIQDYKSHLDQNLVEENWLDTSSYVGESKSLIFLYSPWRAVLDRFPRLASAGEIRR
jgi:hypothetical protein